MILGVDMCALTRSVDDRGDLLRKVKSAFFSYPRLGPVVQPGMPADGAEERPVCKMHRPRNRKVAGPNPARSTTLTVTTVGSGNLGC